MSELFQEISTVVLQPALPVIDQIDGSDVISSFSSHSEE
jgi:hypothetical protein